MLEDGDPRQHELTTTISQATRSPCLMPEIAPLLVVPVDTTSEAAGTNAASVASSPMQDQEKESRQHTAGAALVDEKRLKIAICRYQDKAAVAEIKC